MPKLTPPGTWREALGFQGLEHLSSCNSPANPFYRKTLKEPMGIPRELLESLESPCSPWQGASKSSKSPGCAWVRGGCGLLWHSRQWPVPVGPRAPSPPAPLVMQDALRDLPLLPTPSVTQLPPPGSPLAEALVLAPRKGPAPLPQPGAPPPPVLRGPSRPCEALFPRCPLPVPKELA